MNKYLLAFTTLVVAGLLLSQLLPERDLVAVSSSSAPEAGIQSNTQTNAAPATAAVVSSEEQQPALKAKPESIQRDDIKPEVIQLDPEAIASLRDSIANGDSRAPQLNTTRQRDELPTDAQLADPDLYQAYEQRQQHRVYRAYVEASKIKVAELEQMIALGREQGVSEEEIAFAEQKIQGIKDMAAELQRDYPEIMQDDVKPADNWLEGNLGLGDEGLGDTKNTEQ